LALPFQRPEPIPLPQTHRAAAESSTPNEVTMTLYSLFDDRRGDDVREMSTRMRTEVARDLAIRLWLAADRSKKQDGDRERAETETD
jgi:hypothetical protein